MPERAAKPCLTLLKLFTTAAFTASAVIAVLFRDAAALAWTPLIPLAYFLHAPCCIAVSASWLALNIYAGDPGELAFMGAVVLIQCAAQWLQVRRIRENAPARQEAEIRCPFPPLSKKQ